MNEGKSIYIIKMWVGYFNKKNSKSEYHQIYIIKMWVGHFNMKNSKSEYHQFWRLFSKLYDSEFFLE